MELILSMHVMMQQIIANQPSGSSESVDSYGTPKGSPVGSSATSTGSSFDTSSVISSTSSSPTLTQYGSPTNEAAANTNIALQAANTYNGPQPSNNNQATSNTQDYNSPVIKSTLEQIARKLAKYEPDNLNGNNLARSTNENQASGTSNTGNKPVRFPRNLTVQDLLAVLESMKDLISPEINVDLDEMLRKKEEIPHLKIDTFF